MEWWRGHRHGIENVLKTEARLTQLEARPESRIGRYALTSLSGGTSGLGFTVDTGCDSSGRNALLKTFCDEFWEDVELQHTAAAMQAWGCVDDTAHHSCTTLEYVTYVELQQGAAAVHAWDCIATRGYATRVRVRHVDNRVRVRGHHSCTGSPCAHATLDATVSTV
jgi:hypothetical protein